MPDKVARVRSTRHRRLRSHKLLAATTVIAVIAVLAGGTDLAYASVRSSAEQLQARLTAELQAGQTELEAGKTSLTLANKFHDADWAALAVDHFAVAKEKFLAAGRLADNSQLLRDLERLPAAGDMVRSKHAAVSGIAAMGAAVSDAGRDLAELDAGLIKPSTSGPAGRTLLVVIDQTHSSLTKVRADFDRADKAAKRVDPRTIPIEQQSTFLKARETIASALAGIVEFERLVPVFKEVLGGNGNRLYLVEQVNPAELRPGGGFIGSYSLVQADNGKLSVVSSGDGYDLATSRPHAGQPGFIPLPDPMRDVIPQVSWSFVDSNVFPDFPANARAAEQFVHPNGKNLDGVISIDYYAVAKMLELTGPLAVPGYGRTVDASNFIPLVMQLDLAGTREHKAILSAIAGPLMEQVSALPADRWPSLISDLNAMAAERHIQAYFNDEVVENEINRVGWSGTFNPADSQDYMMAIESNIGGGKVNYFLSRHYTVNLTRTGTTLHHNVTVDLVNKSPYGSYYIVDYFAYASLYVSANVSSPSTNLRPAKYRKPQPPANTWLLEGWLPDIRCCGAQARAIFEYDTPFSWLSRDEGGPVRSGVGKYQVYWQKQPGTVNDTIEVIWNDGYGHTYRATGDLGQDRMINLSPSGVSLTLGQPAQATLPSLGLG